MSFHQHMELKSRSTDRLSRDMWDALGDAIKGAAVGIFGFGFSALFLIVSLFTATGQDQIIGCFDAVAIAVFCMVAWYRMHRPWQLLHDELVRRATPPAPGKGGKT